MRVCHIGFNFFPGRGLTIFYEFARHQAAQGLEVSVIAPGRPGELPRESVDGVHVHRVGLNSIGRFSFDRVRFVRRAARIVRDESFDLIHVYAFVGAGLLPPVSRNRHCVWLYDCQTSAIKPPFLGLQNALIRLESFSYDAITVLSAGIRDIVFGRNKSVEAIVPLGANFELFKPRPADASLKARYAISDADCTFAYCGTLDHNRRIDRLVEAFARVAKEESGAKLLVVGEGSALPELRAQARRLHVQDRIIFTGYVPYRDVPAHLSLARVALAFVPMEACFEHQPPTKTVEYLAQGIAVIATDTAGNRAFIRHDKNGLLIGDGADAHAKAMLDLARDGATRARLAAQARDSVKAYEWGEIVRKTVVPIYSRLLGARLAR